MIFAINTNYIMCIFISVIAFQIILCLAVKCVGVSIVWCSTLGWLIMLLLFMKYHPNDPPTGSSTLVEQNDLNTISRYYQTHVKLLTGVDGIVLLYYAVVAETITTVAHVCAIILGVVLCQFARTRR